MPERETGRAGTTEAAWERAWRERYESATSPTKPQPRRRPAPIRDVLLATAVLGVAISAVAIAGEDRGNSRGSADPSITAARGEGDPVTLGDRNPGSGGSTRETAIVANAGNSGLVLRPSNTAKGGRAVSATCDNDGTAAEDGCAVYVNKGTGAAASFRTQGSVPFALRETNTGLVQYLNADMLDGVHGSDLLRRTEKAADSETLDGKDSGEFLGSSAKAADADNLDGRDSMSFARIGGLVKADGTSVGTGFTSQFVGSDIYYLVSFPAGTFSTSSGCKAPVPVVSATTTGVGALLVHEPEIKCDPATGAGSFRVYVYNHAGGSITGGFSFMVL